jgi:glycyl-tRNA synthetase beta subunit
VLADVLTFVRDRLYVWLRDQGLPHDVVAAVLAERAFDPYRAAVTARDLAELVKTPEWSDVFTAYARCKRIVRSLPEVYPLAPEHYTEPATSALYGASEWANGRMGEWANQRNSESAKQRMGESSGRAVGLLGEVLRDLQAPINRFFTDVLVMAEDPAVRQARIALVQQIAALPDGIADLSRLQGF